MIVFAKCPNCGGDIKFDDSIKTGTCEYCGAMFYTAEVVYQNNNNITNNYYSSDHNDSSTFYINDFTNLVEKLNAYIKISDYSKQDETIKKIVDNYPQKKETWYLFAKVNTISFSNNYFDKVGVFLPAKFIEQHLEKCIHSIESLSTIENDPLASELKQYYANYKESIDSRKLLLEEERLQIISTVSQNLYKYFNGLHIEENDHIMRPVKSSGCNFFFVLNNKLYYRQGHSFHDGEGDLWINADKDIEVVINKEGFLCEAKTGEKYIFKDPEYGYIQIVSIFNNKLLLSNKFDPHKIRTVSECNKYDYITKDYYAANGTYHILKTNEYSEYEYKPIPKKGCYIATCVYKSYDCPEVWTLRRFRDLFLEKSLWGKCFISIYYAISPFIVKNFGEKELFQTYVRKVLNKFVLHLKNNGYSDAQYHDSENL